MYLRSLTLEHFRSYEQCTFAFPDCGLEVMVGPNGSGKTNVIEAVSVLSRGQSCLGSAPDDAVRWGGMFYRVRAHAQKDDGTDLSVEAAFQLVPTKQRAFFENDVRSSLVKIRGVIPTIIFLPEDLTLFTGSPQGRRDFFDAFLEQLSADFVRAKMSFQRIIKQRNALLKAVAVGESSEADLEPWDRELAQVGAVMQVKRLKLAQAFDDGLTKQLGRLGESWDAVHLLYQRKTVCEDVESVTDELLALLHDYRHKELAHASTLIGPHRDDWQLVADGHDVSTFASRGQQRACLLALLFQAMRTIESYRKERPIILLDDVFSELDERHQTHLLDTVLGHQVLLTSTHVPPTAFEGACGLWTFSKEGEPRREGA